MSILILVKIYKMSDYSIKNILDILPLKGQNVNIINKKLSNFAF